MPMSGDEPRQMLHFEYDSDDHISCTRVGQPRTIGRETQNIPEYLKRMQAEDSEFFYASKFNDYRCMRNVSWTDTGSRTARKHFGDSVVFNVSYKADQYQVPLTNIPRVNHHLRPVLFGCVIPVDGFLSSLFGCSRHCSRRCLVATQSR